MHGPAMSGWLLVSLCAASGAYCLVRMRSCSGEAREAAGGEALMSFGMAAMAVPVAVLALPRWCWVLFAALFAAAGVRTAWPGRRSHRHLHHLVGCLAMVYMALSMAPGGAGHPAPGHTTAGVPLLTGALLVYFAGYVLRAGVRLIPLPSPAGGPVPSPAGGPVPPAVAWGARPELAQACRLSMGIATVAMLLAL
ncbi:DUF5134 domain-containing protein [Streptomyces sp. NPDC002187]|uniref:DUF5134 domain-containing protein n=1 Tax=Streptomyces sp. NPDC002187 TaxID=3364637 RepID=UPI0036CFF833